MRLAYLMVTDQTIPPAIQELLRELAVKGGGDKADPGVSAGPPQPPSGPKSGGAAVVRQDTD